MDIVIGIDGGGTACRFALIAGGTRIDLSLGPANVTSDRAGALETLAAGLARLATAAGHDLSGARLHAGLAGVLTPEDAAAVRAALPVAVAEVTDDRPTTMRGALGTHVGTVAAIGTGSFFGRRTGAALRFAGGWGSRLGDEASGAWLGRGLLAATLHAEDGLRPRTPLSALLRARFGGPAEIVAFARDARPADLAALAAEMSAQAADPLAQDLLREGAGWILRSARALGWAPGERLVLAGGLGPAYAPFLDAPTAAPEGSALDGALALAAGLPNAGRA